MKKQTILTILLVLVALVGQAQNQVVWEKPSAFMGASNAKFEITKVELKQTETLPDATINKGVATIKVKLLGYKPEMKKEFMVHGFTPLCSKSRFEKEFPFADDGTVTAEIPLWLPRQVRIGIWDITYPNEIKAFPTILIAPGQETEILMKVTDGQECPFVAFKGYLAKTNMDMQKAYDAFTTYKDDEKIYLKVRNCKTKEERLQCLTDIFNQRVADVKASDYTTATKDLLCMEAESHFVEWTHNFAGTYSHFVELADGTVSAWNDNYVEDCEKNRELLLLSEEEKAYTYKYLNEPKSPCSLAFWESELMSYYDMDAAKKNVHNHEMKLVQTLMEDEYKDLLNNFLEIMKCEDCKNVIREYQAEQQRLAQELGSTEHVFYQKYDDVAPENILQTILDKYKGKAVLIDIWATWCGPCRQGHRLMAPMKQELKDKNIQFVYFSPPSSPLATWQEMIKEIDGDHYYLTNEQYTYILDKYESDGIPTYAIYNTKGEQTFKNIGFPGNDVIRKELEAASK